MPLVHELGHVLVALYNDYTLIQVQILPFPLDSFVIIQTPLNAELTAFWLGGTWLCIVVGATLGFLLPYFKYKWLGLGLSIGFSGSGVFEGAIGSDFTMIGYNWGLLTFCVSVLLLLCAIYMSLRGLKHG